MGCKGWDLPDRKDVSASDSGVTVQPPFLSIKVSPLLTALIASLKCLPPEVWVFERGSCWSYERYRSRAEAKAVCKRYLGSTVRKVPPLSKVRGVVALLHARWRLPTIRWWPALEWSSPLWCAKPYLGIAIIQLLHLESFCKDGLDTWSL